MFKDHILLQERFALQAAVNSLQVELEQTLALSETEELIKIQSIMDMYGDFKEKFSRNTDTQLDVTAYATSIATWGEMLLEKDLDTILSAMEESNVALDASYDEYIASLPPPPTYSSAEGYSYVTVDTSRGTFGAHLIKLPMSSVRVVTASAADSDCGDNCPTKSLSQHVSDNGGFAGLNGSYFCPPDYRECSGKVNSSDYALYKSSSDKWFNKDALSWGDTGLVTFKGTDVKFYKRSSDYGGGSVDAGMSNYPTLLQGGNIVINEDKMTSYQKTARGPRGVIGKGNTNLYLAIINGATVVDAAYAAQAMGMKDALNLDGGGSSAMYINDGYIVGPGRSLPNAIVLTR